MYIYMFVYLQPYLDNFDQYYVPDVLSTNEVCVFPNNSQFRYQNAILPIAIYDEYSKMTIFSCFS